MDINDFSNANIAIVVCKTIFKCLISILLFKDFLLYGLMLEDFTSESTYLKIIKNTALSVRIISVDLKSQKL